jgi:hypothetical protein
MKMSVDDIEAFWKTGKRDSLLQGLRKESAQALSHLELEYISSLQEPYAQIHSASAAYNFRLVEGWFQLMCQLLF